MDVMPYRAININIWLAQVEFYVAFQDLSFARNLLRSAHDMWRMAEKSAGEDFKLEKGPMDKAKEPDPGGFDQQNLEFKKLKNRKTDHTVGLNCCWIEGESF